MPHKHQRGSQSSRGQVRLQNMAEAVRAEMRAQTQTRAHHRNGSTTSAIDTAGARGDYFARCQGADGWQLLARDIPKRRIAERQQRALRNEVDDQKARAPERAHGNGNGSVVGPRPRHVCGGGGPGPGEILVRVQACDLNQVDFTVGDDETPQLCAEGLVCGMDAAGTVIATGEGVIRFASGDEVFGHFCALSWAWVGVCCARTTATGPHVERRPDRLGPRAATALAHCGLTAKTILRAAKPRPGYRVLVIGQTCATGTILRSLLANTGADMIDSAPVEHTADNPVVHALMSHPDLDLCVDLISFGEPYFITPTETHGAIVSAAPCPEGCGIPRIPISAQPGDLAALAQLALDERQLIGASG